MTAKKILIVEDEMIIALLIERMVLKLGHEVIDKVNSGEEAVSAALEHEPDLILMDIRLRGDIDGIEAMTMIQEKKNIPVVYISGNSDRIHQERVNNTDYVEFLSKPITLSELSRSLAS